MRIAGLLLAISMLYGLTAPHALANCRLAKADLPVTMTNGQAFVPAQINDQPVQLVLDSGSFYSTLTPTAAEQLKLERSAIPMTLEGASGSAQAYATLASSFTIAGVKLNHVEFLVGASSVTESAGLLGQNVLGMNDVDYDLGEGMVRLALPVGDTCADVSLAYWAGDAPVSVLPLYRPGEAGWTRAEIMVNGVKLIALLDTGGGATILTRRAAERAGVKVGDPGVQAVGAAYGIGDHATNEWMGRFADVKIGDEEIQNTPLYILDREIEGVDVILGTDFFLSHHVYVSNKQRKIYLTYNGGPVFYAAKTLVRDQAGAAGHVEAAPDGPEPTDADGFSRRGALRQQRGDLKAALADFSQAIGLAPARIDFRKQRIRVEQIEGETQPALSDLDFVLRAVPDDTQALIQRAELRVQIHDQTGAAADLDAADRAMPSSADDRRTLGGIDTDLSRWPQALAQYDLWLRTHQDDPLTASVYNERCWTQALSGAGLDHGLADCDRALSLEPGNAAFLDSRGLVELRMGRNDAAIADYGAALAKQPKQATSLYGRGLAELALHQAKAAQTDIAAAKVLDPKLADQWAGYGIAPPRAP